MEFRVEYSKNKINFEKILITNMFILRENSSNKSQSIVQTQYWLLKIITNNLNEIHYFLKL